jgi:hypothetical protein
MKPLKFLIYLTGALLLAAALERFMVAFGSSQALALLDPLLGIPLRFSVVLVGALELTVAIICLFGKRPGMQLGWVAWLTLDYFLFRVGLIAMECHSQASCVGTLTDPLHLARGSWAAIVTFFPVYLLASGFGGMAWLWFANRMAKTEKCYKISCFSCGTHLQFSRANAGQKISCPNCQAAVTLRKPDDYLRMPCEFCQRHIEFPASALGTKLNCPHCNKDLTLKELATV